VLGGCCGRRVRAAPALLNTALIVTLTVGAVVVVDSQKK